ncbi:MAG: hypothetical protein U5K33_00105 [Halofilum sp. (in: g-proteobacteria)]|nr:hypothetical protein [Halofilum sp. (in: g-proteobacteria)]
MLIDLPSATFRKGWSRAGCRLTGIKSMPAAQSDPAAIATALQAAVAEVRSRK